MLIGTPEKEIEEIQKGAPDDLPEIINDLDDVGDDVALQGTFLTFMTSHCIILANFRPDLDCFSQSAKISIIAVCSRNMASLTKF